MVAQPAEDADLPADEPEVGGDRHPRQDQRGHGQRGGPPEPDAGAHRQRRVDHHRDGGQHPGGDGHVAHAPAAQAGPVQAEEAQHEQRGQLHRRGADDEDRPAEQVRIEYPGARPQPDLDPGQHEPDHQRLVVDAADQVEQHERVADPEPQREADIDPAAAGQPGQRPDDEGEPDQREHAVGEDAEHDVVAGERGDAAADDEEERPVRGGRVAPDRGDRADQRIVDAEAAPPGRTRRGRCRGRARRSGRGSCRRRGRTAAAPARAARAQVAVVRASCAIVGAGATAPW